MVGTRPTGRSAEASASRTSAGVRAIRTSRPLNAQRRSADHERLTKVDRFGLRQRPAANPGPVPAGQVGETETPVTFFEQPRVFPRDIPIDGDARGGHRVISTDGDLPLESPRFSVERPAHHLEDVHRWTAFARPGRPVLSGRKPLLVKREDPNLLEVEPEALRAAEFMQAKELLSSMEGRRVVSARLEETRIAIAIDDGTTYFFYGFMGEERTPSETGD
jgi:hypothetical protein